MENPRRFRVVEQHFLNLPGFHAGAYIRAYVEDTSEREVNPGRVQRIPVPLIELELSDCYRRIELDFCLTTPEQRLNSFHKIDTMVAALHAFRDGLAAEATLYRRRARDVEVTDASAAPSATHPSARSSR